MLEKCTSSCKMLYKSSIFNTSLQWEAMLVLVGAAEVGDLSRDVRRGETLAVTVLVGERKTSVFRVLSAELGLDWDELSVFTFQNKGLKSEQKLKCQKYFSNEKGMGKFHYGGCVDIFHFNLNL